MEYIFIFISLFRFFGLVLVGLVFISEVSAEAVKSRRSIPLSKKLVFFELPSQPLKLALVEFGIQAGVNIVVPAHLVSPYESIAVVGRYGIGRALEIVLSNTPLIYRVDPISDTFVLEFPQNTNPENRAPHKPSEVEDVLVVSARHHEESLQDVPISLSVFSGEDLDRDGIQDLVQLGVSLANTTLQVVRGSSTTLAAYIRGVGQDEPLAGYDSGVGVYVDDIFLNRPQGAVLDLYDVERIEVLRGPQGTLYGRNTIGGAIKYITRKLSDDPSLRVKAYAGNFHQQDIIVSASTPLTNSGLKVGSSFGLFTRDGYGNNLVTGDDNYDKNIFVGRASIEYTASEDVFIRIYGDMTKSKTNPRRGHRFIQGSEEVPLNNIYDTKAGTTTSTHPVNHSNESAHTVAGSLSWSLGDGFSLEMMSAYREDKSQLPGDFDSLPQSNMSVPTIYKNRQFSQELKLKFEMDRIQGLLGLFYLDANALHAYDLELITEGFGVFTLADVDMKSWAAFTSINVEMTESFNVSIGARYTTEQRDIVAIRDVFILREAEDFISPYFGGGIIPVPLRQFDSKGEEVVPRFSDMREDSKFTPRISISWQPHDMLHLYSSYSTGFRSGGFDPRGDYGDPKVREGFSPETLDAYEIGLKTAYFNGALTSNFAVFHSDYRKIQIKEENLTNAAKANISGAELEVAANLSDRVRADLAIGLIEAEYVKYINKDGENVADDRVFANTPKSTVSFSLSGGNPVGGGELSWRVSANYRSGVSLSVNPPSELEQESYTLFNGSIVWESGSGTWQFGLYGLNLSGEEYKVAGYYFPQYDVGTAFFGDPRTFKVSLKRSF